MSCSVNYKLQLIRHNENIFQTLLNPKTKIYLVLLKYTRSSHRKKNVDELIFSKIIDTSRTRGNSTVVEKF